MASIITPIQPGKYSTTVRTLCQEILVKHGKDDEQTNANGNSQTERNVDPDEELLNLIRHTCTSSSKHPFEVSPLLIKTVTRMISSSSSGYYRSVVGAKIVSTLCSDINFDDNDTYRGGKSFKQESGDQSSSNTFDLLCGAAPFWFDGLVTNIENHFLNNNSFSLSTKRSYFGIVINENSQNGNNDDSIDFHIDSKGIVAYLEALTSLVSTCKHKVKTSKNSGMKSTRGIIDKLQRLSWDIMGSQHSNGEILCAATRLSAITPILGQLSSQLPAELWSQALYSSLAALCICIHASWPNKALSNSYVDWAVKDGLGDGDQWLVRFKPSITIQQKRKTIIMQRIEALSRLIIALFEMHGYSITNNENVLKTIEVPLAKCLQVCELMIKFGSGAEGQCLLKSSVFKKGISGVGALLSPTSVVELIPPIRSFGLDILNSILSSSKVSLLSMGKRISALMEYCVDGVCSTAIQVQAKSFHLTSFSAEQWLNRSSFVRTNTIRVLRTMMLSLGCSIIPMLEKSLIKISASLLEEIVMEKKDYSNGGDWSSSENRMDLISNSCKTLAAAIHVGGSFISIHCRSSIEGVLVSCLASLKSSESATLMKTSTTKIALLNLAKAVLCSPWRDGGSSTLHGNVYSLTLKLKFDRDMEVVFLAYELLNICDAMLLPRAPPIVVATRSAAHTSQKDISEIQEQIEQNRMEIKKKQESININKNKSLLGTKRGLEDNLKDDSGKFHKSSKESQVKDNMGNVEVAVEEKSNSTQELKKSQSLQSKEENLIELNIPRRFDETEKEERSNDKTMESINDDIIESSTKNSPVKPSKIVTGNEKDFDIEMEKQSIQKIQDKESDDDSCPDIDFGSDDE